ncbi:hypothetical protein ACFV2N_16920 [Streptomyces sp. NPDC059680]|uniref:hypothetical protein n=1 Tax=Streptomyces sp. NPDC059680 TaxID=3346904 RepID=UPI0036977415
MLHFIAGKLFALGHWALFLALGHSSWWLGALFGLGHGMFAGTALVNILLPLVHPRTGTPLTSAPDVALLEPPASSCSTTAWPPRWSPPPQTSPTAPS